MARMTSNFRVMLNHLSSECKPLDLIPEIDVCVPGIPINQLLLPFFSPKVATKWRPFLAEYDTPFGYQTTLWWTQASSKDAVFSKDLLTDFCQKQLVKMSCECHFLKMF